MPSGNAKIIVGTDGLKPPVEYEPHTVAVVASVGAQGDMCQSRAYAHGLYMAALGSERHH